KPGEIDRLDAVAAEHHVQATHLVMRKRQEVLLEAEFGEQVDRRRVDGVTAEVTEEVGVLLEHHHVDARLREKEPERGAGRAPAPDATRRREAAGAHRLPYLSPLCATCAACSASRSTRESAVRDSAIT